MLQHKIQLKDVCYKSKNLKSCITYINSTVELHYQALLTGNIQSKQLFHQFGATSHQSHHRPPFLAENKKKKNKGHFSLAPITHKLLGTNTPERDTERERERERDLIRSLFCSETTAIKQESNRVNLNRLAITICVHKLFQLSASFDPEKDFIPILQSKYKLVIHPHHTLKIQFSHPPPHPNQHLLVMHISVSRKPNNLQVTFQKI